MREREMRCYKLVFYLRTHKDDPLLGSIQDIFFLNQLVIQHSHYNCLKEFDSRRTGVKIGVETQLL